MITLKIKRSSFWEWFVESKEEFGILESPVGTGNTVQRAIDDFIRCFTMVNGFTPEYKLEQHIEGMFINIQAVGSVSGRIYSFECDYQAEEFAKLFGGTARSGKDESGRWIAVL